MGFFPKIGIGYIGLSIGLSISSNFVIFCDFYRLLYIFSYISRVSFPSSSSSISVYFFYFYRFVTFRIRFLANSGDWISPAQISRWLIRSGRKIYVGATTDTTRRLQQHNGELTGGASYTRGTSDWRYEAIVSGFRTWREALQFEWALKHHTRKARDAKGKTQALHSLLSRDQWTVNSPLADEVPLTLELTSKKASRIPTR